MNKMLSINEYFDGKVKSIGFETTKGRATIGVMSPGEYAFGTSTVEQMTVTSGEMSVLLPDEKVWKLYKEGESFKIEKDKKFAVKTSVYTAYKCIYIE